MGSHWRFLKWSSEAIRGLTPICSVIGGQFLSLCLYPLSCDGSAPRPRGGCSSLPSPATPRLAHPGTYTEDSGVEQQGQGGQEVIGALLLDLCAGQEGRGSRMGCTTQHCSLLVFLSFLSFFFFLLSEK